MGLLRNFLRTELCFGSSAEATLGKLALPDEVNATYTIPPNPILIIKAPTL